MSKKTLSFKSLGWLSIINLAIAITGVLQTIIIARFFGASREIEVYFAATTFLVLLMKVSSSGQIGELFTPIFHEILIVHGRKASHRAFSAMTNVMGLFAVAVFLFGWFFARPIANYLVPGFSPEDLELCASFFIVSSPLVVVQVINGMFSNFLQAEHHYGVNESLSLIARIVNLLVLILFSWAYGVWALIFGLWISAVIRLIGQVSYAWRQDFRHCLAFSTQEFHPRKVLSKVPYSFSHIFSAQFAAFMSTAGLSFLPEGTYAVYTYATQLGSKFSGLVLQPIGIVFFNRISQSVAEGADHVKDLARHALALAVASATLCVVPVICGGDFLLQGLWGGEKFSPNQIKDTHLVLVVVVSLLVVNAQYVIARRTNLALKVIASEYFASGSVQILAGICSYWVIPRFGLWGAIVVQVFAVTATAAASLTVLRWKNRQLVALIPFRKSCQWLVTGLIAVLATMLLRSMLPVNFSENRLQMVVAAAGFGLFSMLVCIGFSWFLGIPESQDLYHRVRQRLLEKRVSENV